jgi:hypothetical protein
MINYIPTMRSIIRIVEGEVVRFPNSPIRPVDTKPDEQMISNMRSLRAIMTDMRPIRHLYQKGDVLRHRDTGEVVDVEAVESDDDPTIVVKVRSTGTTRHFYADEFDPVPVAHW